MLNTSAELSLAAKVPQSAVDWIVLLGKAPAIDGFFLSTGIPFQLKSVQAKPPALQPGGIVDAVKEAAQKAGPRGWRNIALYVNAPSVPTDVIDRRWRDGGPHPRLEPRDVDGTLGRLIVFGLDGVIELPLRLPVVRQ
jgi:hypothetical protein